MDVERMTPEERIRMVERVYVTYPRLTRIREKIQYCHEHSRIAAEPECLLITGQTGAGKTMLCKAYTAGYPPILSKAGLMVPVLSTSIPVPATGKSLVTKLLLALGDPMPEKGTQVNQTLRLTSLLEECGVQLLVLDEFQHFIDRESNSVLQNVANWLKDLLNATGIPMILVGMPYSDIILRTNDQLERRFTMREELAPFGWETSEKQQEFKMFLRYLDESLPLPQRSNLTDHEMALRIYRATRGTTGYLMKLIRRAAILGITRSAERLNLDLLAEVYEERLAAGRIREVNPFRASTASLNVEPHEGGRQGGPFGKGRSKSRRDTRGVLTRSGHP